MLHKDESIFERDLYDIIFTFNFLFMIRRFFFSSFKIELVTCYTFLNAISITLSLP